VDGAADKPCHGGSEGCLVTAKQSPSDGPRHDGDRVADDDNADGNTNVFEHFHDVELVISLRGVRTQRSRNLTRFS
jgi:hypothetical protein